MPNKLPELYLYRLIPGAKQPSRWNIKSRYPVPVVPPAPTAVINPDKPTLTYFPGSTGPVIKQTPGPDTGKITVTAALRIIFSKQTGGSPLRTYNIFMAVNGRIVAQLLNVQIPNPNPPLPFIIDVPLNTLYYDRMIEKDKNTISFTATVDNTDFKESVSNILSFSYSPYPLPPSDQNLDDDELLAIDDESTAVTNVSFSMIPEDRESYKSGVTVTFSFTPKTASPSSVKLNYPSGFFSTYPTPTCTVSVEGTIMTPGAPGDNAITLSVTGTALAAKNVVTVNLIGCKMGNSMSASSITVQTDKDIIPSTPVSSGDIEDNHKAKALVITCIDFRLVDEALAHLTSMALLNEYDEMIVAGACLGYNTSCYNVKLGDNYPRLNSAPTPPDTNPDTNSTLWTDCVDDHISISSALHSISEIIVIDHLGCGAYNGQFGGTSANPINIYDELKYHVEQLNTFRTTINGKYQKAPYNITSVIPLLMSLDGSVDVNPTHWDVNNLSFNIAKDGLVSIGQDGNVIPYLPIPTTTMSTPLSYELLNADMTATINSTGGSASINKGATNWIIQNSSSGKELPSGGIVYNLRVAGTKAYIKLSMTANGDAADTVKFTFSQGTYTAQSGWS